MAEEVARGRRRRRTHSAEFKSRVAAACMQPGVSIASIAMANGVNANLARRWVLEIERGTGKVAVPSTGQAFVPLQLPAPAQQATAEIRIDLRRGPTTISVSWPSTAAAECASWMRELLR